MNDDTQHQHTEPGPMGGGEQHETVEARPTCEHTRPRTCHHCGWKFPSAEALANHRCPTLKRHVKRTVSTDLVAVATFAYTHNPFYLISACLFLYGVSMMFSADDMTRYAWTLLGVVAGYSALLVGAAALIIRLGKVWDDARAIVLLVVVLLITMSGSFDQIIIQTESLGKPLLLTGLAVAIGLSEALLRGVGIRLPALFRGAYYVILAFFFMHPLAMLQLLHRYPGQGAEPVSWGLFLFPMAAAVVFLVLIPAARMGSAYVRDGGTPWAWPWYPWALFGLLALAVCVRSYWLTITCYPAAGWSSPWGLYLLSPFVIGVAAVALEIGVVSNQRRMIAAAMAMPIVAMLIAFPGRHGNAAQAAFQHVIYQGFGSPVLLTMTLAAGFYAYAWLRRVRMAEAGVVVALLALALTPAWATSMSELAPSNSALVAAVAVVQGVQALRRRESWRALLAAAATAIVSDAWWPDAWVRWQYGVIPIHLMVGALLVIGLIWRDRLAKRLQDAGAFALAGLFVTACFAGRHIAPNASNWAWWTYLTGVAVVTVAYGLVVRNRLYLHAVIVEAAAVTVYLAAALYQMLSRPNRPRWAMAMFWCGVTFVVATGISLAKAGLMNRAKQRQTLVQPIAKEE